jgi:hypothetical protein
MNSWIGLALGLLRLWRSSHLKIPDSAISRPIRDMSVTTRPENDQLRTTIVHVLLWPTTVLATGPVCAIIKNWEILINMAKIPDYKEISFRPCCYKIDLQTE